MSWVIKTAWIVGVCVVVGLVLSTGAEPIIGALGAAGWGLAVVCLLRAIAVAGAGVGWFILFPRDVRPSVLTCIAVRFLREGANALLPLTLVGGNVIGFGRLLCAAFPPPFPPQASLSMCSLRP